MISLARPLLLASVVVALSLACGPLPAAPPRAAPAPATDPAVRCPGDWQIRLGPAVSATNPHPTDYYRPGEHVPLDTYFSMTLDRAKPTGALPPGCVITSTLYHLQGGTKVLATQSDRTFGPGEDTFYKSWILKAPGDFEIEVREADSRRVMAVSDFVAGP